VSYMLRSYHNSASGVQKSKNIVVQVYKDSVVSFTLNPNVFSESVLKHPIRSIENQTSCEEKKNRNGPDFAVNPLAPEMDI